jgi:predicted HTH domain antitoxin
LENIHRETKEIAIELFKKKALGEASKLIFKAIKNEN